MKYIIVLLLLLISFSCEKQSNLAPEQIKTGTFKTIIKEGDYQSLAERNDSIQIETFNQKKDTFHIKWKNNFEYILTKKNPKTDLDKKSFIVKITGIKQHSYTFSASFEGSSYKQNGEAEKLH